MADSLAPHYHRNRDDNGRPLSRVPVSIMIRVCSNKYCLKNDIAGMKASLLAVVAAIVVPGCCLFNHQAS